VIRRLSERKSGSFMSSKKQKTKPDQTKKHLSGQSPVDSNGYPMDGNSRLCVTTLTISESPHDIDGKRVENLAAQFFADVPPYLNDPFIFLALLIAVALLVLSSIGIKDHKVTNGIPLTNSSFFDHVNETSPEIGAVLSYALPPAIKNFGFRWGTVQFLVVFIMSWFSIFFSEVDHFHRVTQPFIGMSKPNPPQDNLLLEYPLEMQGVVSIKAMLNGHWKVAGFSALSLLSNSGPVFATGLFTRQDMKDTSKILITPSEFWAGFAFLVSYTVAILFARPTLYRRLPRRIRSPIDMYTYCYASRILDDLCDEKPIFEVCDPTDEKIHLVSRLHLDKAKYLFGIYLGKDGRRHIGFDKDQRQKFEPVPLDSPEAHAAPDHITAKEKDLVGNRRVNSSGDIASQTIFPGAIPSSEVTGGISGAVPGPNGKANSNHSASLAAKPTQQFKNLEPKNIAGKGNEKIYVDTVVPDIWWFSGIFFWTDRYLFCNRHIEHRGPDNEGTGKSGWIDKASEIWFHLVGFL
jgi:hypothetical protein